MTAPKALLFDWDNTLVESWDAIHHALVVTFEAMGHEPWSLDETKARVRRSLRDAFPALFGTRWEEARGALAHAELLELIEFLAGPGVRERAKTLFSDFGDKLRDIAAQADVGRPELNVEVAEAAVVGERV